MKSLFLRMTATVTTKLRMFFEQSVPCSKDRPVKSLLCQEEHISIFIDDRERYVLEVGYWECWSWIVCSCVWRVHPLWRVPVDLLRNQGRECPLLQGLECSAREITLSFPFNWIESFLFVITILYSVFLLSYVYYRKWSDQSQGKRSGFLK